MRRARSFKAVAVGTIALGAVVLAVMGALYVRYVRYVRVAARHLPPEPVLIARVDVEQAIFYEPIRRHILPLFGGPGDSPTQADARLSRIEARSRLRRADLREIVVARGADRADWVVVLGGLFPRDSGKLPTAVADEPGWTLADDGTIAIHGTGVAVARADDGAIVVASSKAVIGRALSSSDASERLGLPSGGAGGFALSAEALGELARFRDVLAAGSLPADLSHLDSVTGQFVPGDRIALVVRFRGADVRGAEQSARGVLELMRQRSRSSSSRAAELLRAGLDRAAVGQGPQGIELSVEWEREEVDYALASLADVIRARW